MKVLVNFTCFMDDDVFKNHIYYKDYLIQEFMFQVFKDINYKVNRAIIGLHEEANRPHYHLFVLAEMNEGAKKYKILNEKLQRVMRLMEYPSKLYSRQEIKISYVYEGESRKYKKARIVYDETSMRYPLKEGNNHYSVYNVPDVEFKSLRLEAINQYNIYKQKKLTEETKSQLKKTEAVKLEDFIVEKLTEHDETVDPRTKVKVTAGLIIEYSIHNDINFNINNLKNKSINILRKYNFITTSEVLSLIYI